MSAPAATAPKGLPDDYYAPAFSLTVEGKKLPPETVADVLEVKVVLDVDDLASVDIKLNNYDDANWRLKWSDHELFKLNHRVHVQLGYADQLVSMLRGPIQTLSAEFPSNGAATLTVRAMDPLVVLKNSKPPETGVTYKPGRDWEIAREIAQRHNLGFHADKNGPPHQLVVQRNIDDLAFLTERAARIDHKVFIRSDPKTKQDVLHFIKPRDGRDADPVRTFELAWGTLTKSSTPPSMIEFKPIITINDQVQSVTVRGWDVERKKAITHTATATTTPGVTGSGKATGPAAAEDAGGAAGKKEIVVNAPVASKEEARELAESLLAERSYRFLTASGKTMGLPDLRAGDNLEISGVGTTFSGTYYVTKVTHVLNASGYTTEFEVRKTFQGTRK